MRQPQTGKRWRQTLTRRALLLGGAQLAVAGGLAWQMRKIAVDQSQSFRLLADENRINIRLLPPTRGLIFDRLGTPLAYNEPNYKIDMVREQAGDPEAVLRRLQALIPLTDEDIARALETMAARRAFVPVTVAEDLGWEHVAAVSANAPALPGVSAELGHYRVYPKSGDFAHVVGYVGPVSDYDLKQRQDDDPLLMIPRFQIGKTGVERRIDRTLRGKAGVERIEVNSVGRVMRVLGREEPKPGADVQLTLDNRLQRYALERMGEESAAVVVMDVTNGDIVALASAPSFDPNKFVRGISVTDWKALNEDDHKPLLNKTVTGTYPPGSTFKMITALAALEAGIVTPQKTVTCNGFTEVSGQRFHCWRRGGHGKVSLRKSLRESCDVYYYELAQEIGIEAISAMARRFGLGESHAIELPAVRAGLTPTKEWKRQNRGADWVIGDTLNAAIGQGFVLASPLQLAVMTARLATGTQIAPRLINALDNRPWPVRGREPLGLAPEHLAAVREGMWAVVNEQRGTAAGARLRLRGVQMAGKTGTSQVRRITREERARGVYRNEDLPWERRDHALFVGYAPAEAPRFAVAVVVEHGGSGSAAAAPIARDVITEALELAPDMDYRALPTRVSARRGRKA